MLSINFNKKPETVITVTVNHPALMAYVWQPSYLETILFFDEDVQRFKIGRYLDLWNNLRNLRSAADDRLGKHYEGSPIHNEKDSDGQMVIRARVIDIATGLGKWADIGYILEDTPENLEITHEQNRVIRQQEAIDRLEAFGEVEAA